MTDEPLKTLKEIERNEIITISGSDSTEMIIVESKDLRAKAIRQVKLIDGLTEYKQSLELVVDCEGKIPIDWYPGRGCGTFIVMEILAIRRYIMWQNNLTEEDLK